MTHKYRIGNMTCSGCLGKIEKTLNGVVGVNKAILTLVPAEAIITMDKHISTEVLKNALSKIGSYTIDEI